MRYLSKQLRTKQQALLLVESWVSSDKCVKSMTQLLAEGTCLTCMYEKKLLKHENCHGLVTPALALYHIQIHLLAPINESNTICRTQSGCSVTA